MKKTRLLIVDSYVGEKSPTMKGIVNTFYQIAELFDEVEVWAAVCEIAEHPKVKWVRFPNIPTAALQLEMYFQLVRLRFLFMNKKNWDLIMVSGFAHKKADIRFIQFSNIYFGRIIQSHPEKLSIPMWKIMLNKRAANIERKCLNGNDDTRFWWVVSRRLGEEIYEDSGRRGNLRITPNSYDASQFNCQLRLKYRSQMRIKYGFSENERVLSFVGMGHFERKGLKEAIEAISISRKRGYPLKIIVFGGSVNTIRRFKKRLDKYGIDTDGAYFVGSTKEVGKHLCAADAMLFPSYFEAFSLAEIEAAALGLRLYLTPHYGTEMILREGVNGREIPWNPVRIAEILEEEYDSGALGSFHQETCEAVNNEAYAIMMKDCFQEALHEVHRDNASFLRYS